MTAKIPSHFAELRLRALEKRLELGGPGPQGAQGEIGATPTHEWEGTRLRFEQSTGAWGRWVDLIGPPGATSSVQYMGGGFGPQGPQGAPGAGIGGGAAGVPTRIRAGAVFTVPSDTQLLFASTIDCEGILDCEGLLIEAE